MAFQFSVFHIAFFVTRSLEFMKSSVSKLGDAVGNETWKTGAGLEILWSLVQYLHISLFWLGTVGLSSVRVMKHRREDSW